MTTDPPQPLRVVTLESRQAPEMVRLLERHGCTAINAPSMREVPLSDQTAAAKFGQQLMAAKCDVLVLLTGVGARLLLDVLNAHWTAAQLTEALDKTQLVCRGPKPVAVLKSMGLRAAAVADEPNTWKDLLAVFDTRVPVAGKTVVVQEYGQPSLELCAALAQRGAKVNPLPLYGWALPQDTGPLRTAIALLCGGEADAILFTSRRQVDHLLQIAAEQGQQQQLRRALSQTVLVVSIGPVTSESLQEHGLAVDLVPVHPKMGQLVQAVARQGVQLLAAKRARFSAS